MKKFATPMTIEPATASDNFQFKLLDLQSDVKLKEAFKSKGLLDFWSRFPEKKYPNLIDNALKNAYIFGSIYVCEALFSKMVKIIN